MSKKLAELTDEKERIDQKIETELRRLRKGCTHQQAFRTYIGGGDGYLMMCCRCFVEEHHWAPYLMGNDTQFTEVAYNEFMEQRPPGSLFLLEYDNE